MDSLYCICPPPSVSAVTYTAESVMDFSTALMVGAESFTSELVMEAADVSLTSAEYSAEALSGSANSCVATLSWLG